jgi:hypothetical protein
VTVEVPTVLVYFGLEYSGGSYFTIGDPVKGIIGNGTYLIAGDDGTGVNVNQWLTGFRISRGRSRELDEFQTGIAEIVLENMDRTFDGMNAAGPYYGDLTPGKRVDIMFHGQMIFAGTIEDWDLEWPTGEMPTATIIALDALGELARKEFDEWTTTGSQAAGARLDAMLNRPEVAFPAGRRNFDVGQSILQADLVTWGSNALNYAQLVVRSDGGRLYASRSNVLTFDDRHSIIGATAAVELRDDLTGVEFDHITTQNGSELLFTRVGIDREGGTLQTSEETGPGTPQAMYGVRQLSITGLLMDTDAQSAAMSSYLYRIYSDPADRIASIVVNVSALSASEKALMAAVELGNLVRVVWTPANTGAQVDQQLVVEGIDHEWQAHQPHVMTLRTSPVYQTGAFIIGDPVRGIIGNTDYLIAF